MTDLKLHQRAAVIAAMQHNGGDAEDAARDLITCVAFIFAHMDEREYCISGTRGVLCDAFADALNGARP